MANKDVIIACDFGTREETLAFLDRFTGGKALCRRSAWNFFTGRARRSCGR